MKGVLFFGIVLCLVGVYFFLKVRAQSILKESNNPETALVGLALAVFFSLLGVNLMVLSIIIDCMLKP